jgi:hypothetical protein
MMPCASNPGKELRMTAGTRAKYLIFALTIRKLTDALINLVEEGKRAPNLDAQLKEVLASVKGTGKPTSVKALRNRGSFGSYEGVVTLDEVMKSSDQQALVDMLNSVITTKSAQEQKKRALKVIEFFDALESRALYRYNHPVPRMRSITA